MTTGKDLSSTQTKTKPNKYQVDDQSNLEQSAAVSRQPPGFFENQLFSYKEAARYLRISDPYLRRLKQQGKIPFVQVSRRGVRFRLSSLDKWVEEREIR